MIKIAFTDQDIQACFDVMVQLRPHLKKNEFLTTIKSLISEGYYLISLTNRYNVIGVAGFTLEKNLLHGKYLHVDDLITCEKVRSQGAGKQLMNWIIKFAQCHNCSAIQLDSNLQHHDAHRFYMNQKMKVVSHHFHMAL